MVDPSSNRVVFCGGIRNEATVPQVVLLALLGQRVLNLLDDSLPEGMSPKELEDASGKKGNSIRPALKGFADQGIVLKSGEVYLVPPHALDEAGVEL